MLAEEFLLLALDDATGKKRLSAERLEPALGGALVAELALAERVGVTPPSAGWRQRGRITITNTDPTDDAELDRMLAVLVEREGKKLKEVFSPMTFRRPNKGLTDRLLERLARAGIVGSERTEVLGLARWPTRDPAPEAELRARLRAALVDRTTPTERTVALVALLQVTRLVPKLFPEAERKALKARAKELTEGDWAAEAVRQVITETEALVASAAAAGAAGGGNGG